MSSYTTTDLAIAPLADELIVNRSGTTARQAIADLSVQLLGSGALGVAVNGLEAAAEDHGARLTTVEQQQTTNNVIARDWADLETLTPAMIGQGAEIPDAATGTHLDPLTDFSVPDAGRYKGYALTPGAWTRIADTGLMGKASNARVDRLASGDFTELSDFQVTRLVPDAGYAWAVTDGAGYAALLVAADGTVSIPKFALNISDGAINRAMLDSDLTEVTAQRAPVESGYAWAVTDSKGRIALAVTPQGGVVGSFAASIDGDNLLLPSRTLWCIGDSGTAGAGGGQATWVAQLPALLDYPRSIINGGVGGETSAQIAVRVGAVYAVCNLPDYTIPASGSVSFIDAAISIWVPTVQKGSIEGYLGGVYGTMTVAYVSPSWTFSFTRAAAGDAVWVGPRAEFVPKLGADDWKRTVIVMIGRNNLSEPEQIKADYEAIINRIETQDKRFLVMTPWTGGSLTEGVPTDEGVGTTAQNTCIAIERWAKAKWGDRVLCTRTWSWQYASDSADDQADVAAGTVPRSLRMDTVHWNQIYHGHVAAWVADQINKRGW